ncbi:MAG: trypsin-like peptidase domain-containing protein [Eubacteriales bacterium]|nr:trypsin-like peptidase domain-containing protein [Eubacteriales bacterium]
MSDYRSYEQKPKGNNLAWLWATLILIAFIGGIIAAQFIFGGWSQKTNALQTPTATPAATAAPQATKVPSATKAPAGSISSDNSDFVMDGSTASDAFANAADFSDVISTVSPTVVGVSNRVASNGLGYNNSTTLSGDTEQGYGSGVIISSNGYIVTNNHVIEGADSVTVILQGGEEVEAKVVGADSLSDLAVLKIDRTGLTAVTIGDSSTVKVGQWAIAIGNPLGQRYADTTTFGIVSGVDREVVSDGYTRYMIQTDAAINPGNSGGALVNAKGELIGINTLKSQYVDSSNGYGYTLEMAEGIGLAIRSNDMVPIVQEIIQKGYVDRPILGISGIREVDVYTARANNVPTGVMIRQVTSGGPAEKAGLKGNDIITAIDGTEISTYDELRGIINSHNIGDVISVTVYRYDESKSYDFQVTLVSTTDMQTAGGNQ